jgi:hypothetical protein
VKNKTNFISLTQKSIKMETKDQDWPYLKYKRKCRINDQKGEKKPVFYG